MPIHVLKLITPFITFCTFAHAQNAPSGGTGEWKTLDESNFVVQYPSSWELNQSGQQGTTFIVLSAMESADDKFRENVNLIIQDLTGHNLGLDEYTVISTDQIRHMIPNSSILENKKMSTANHEFQKVIYTGEPGTYKLKFEQYYFVIDKQAFVLTLTCEQDKFDQFEEVGERILKSFRLK